MHHQVDRQLQKNEMIIADALIGFATELRMIDVVNLVASVRNERHNHWEELINSAAERFFKPGTLRFSRVGGVELNWDRPGAVIFSMEIYHKQLSVHFRLLIDAEHAGVQLELLDFGTDDLTEEAQDDHLAEILEDARLELSPRILANYYGEVPSAGGTGLL